MNDKQLEKRLQESLNAALSGLQTTPCQRGEFFENALGGNKVKRKLTYSLILALAIALLIATAGVAFAITNGFGLLDFARSGRDSVEIPRDAAQYIEHDIKTVSLPHATVVFREASYTGKTCQVAYDVIPKSRDMLLFDVPLDESWYAQTHLEIDRDAMKADQRTVADRYEEGGYTSLWEVDFDVDDAAGAESIQEYGNMGSVLNVETGVFTGTVEIPFETIKSERTIGISVRLLPLTDARDEFSYDYDRAETAVLEYHGKASLSGEEAILENEAPLDVPSLGLRIEKVRLMLFPQEIQYQILYTVTDEKTFGSFFSRDIGVPSFRFVRQDGQNGKAVLLSQGISDHFTNHGPDDSGIYTQTGSLGRSAVLDEYALGVFTFRELLKEEPRPLDVVTFRAQLQNPDTFTPEERVWQQESDRSKPHNQADDTFVNPGKGDLPEAEAVAIAKSAILKTHDLPDGALDHARAVANLYVTNARPDYRRWFIQFEVLKEGSDSYVERFYSCIVDQEGNVIADPDIDEPSLEEKAAASAEDMQKQLNRPDYVKKYLEYFRAHEDIGGFFWYWPYDVKAAYWQDMQPWVNDVPLETDTEVGMTLYYAYGMPGADEISHDDAVRMAKEAVKEKYRLADEQMKRYQVFCESFDISGKLREGNVWKFVLMETGDRTVYNAPRYWVVLDAKTGQTVMNEEFQWQTFRKDLEYDLKYY